MEREFLNNISVIIPSLNPDEKLNKTIESLLSVGFTDIVCVNDGSSAECLPNFPKPSENITLLVHKVNEGKGAALKTAFKYIRENRPDSVGAITVDGDGQHAACDVLNCAKALIERKDNIILGCRDFSKENVPPRSRFGNKLTSGVFKVFCGMKVSDTQTGLRAFPSECYKDMLEISGDRFEYETNMLLEMKARKIPYSEVEIETVYIEENKTSHFRPIKDSIRIYSLIFSFSCGQFLKFFACSFLSFLVDGLLVYLLLKLAEKIFEIDFGIKTLDVACVAFGAKAIARIFSSLLNYSMNRKVVFPTDVPIKKSLLKYYCLAIPLLLTSAMLTAIFENIPIFNTAFLIMLLGYLIDFILFFVNYFIQKKWVFK